MATKTERIEILKLWAEHFPQLIMFKDQWLLKRNGPVLSGILIDRTSDKNKYRALYFMSVLDMNDFIPISHSQEYKGRYAGKELRYDRFDSNDIEQFKKQLPILKKELTFKDYFSFIEGQHDRESMVLGTLPTKGYMLRELALVGAYCKDKDFYLDQMPLAKKLLRDFDKECGPFENPVNIQQWEEETLRKIDNIYEVVQNTITSSGFSNLKDNGMEYKRIDNYLQRLKIAIYNYYPALKGCSKKL
jgi:hypothetical protein